MNRRDAVKTLVAAGAGAAMGAPLMGSPAGPAKITRKVPKNGEMIPVIGLGTSRVFDVGTGADERAAVKDVLEALVAAGGRVVDASPMYGRAEGVVGEIVAAAGLRKSLFLASKVWTTGHHAGVEQVETSLRLMGDGRVDLMQVHNLVDLKTQLTVLRKLKEVLDGTLEEIRQASPGLSGDADLEAIFMKAVEGDAG